MLAARLSLRLHNVAPNAAFHGARAFSTSPLSRYAAAAPTKGDGSDFNALFVGAGYVSLGALVACEQQLMRCPGHVRHRGGSVPLSATPNQTDITGPWNISRRLESRLGSRLKVGGVIEVNPARADAALRLKRESSAADSYDKAVVLNNVREYRSKVDAGQAAEPK